ncbi:MAG: 1-deoxy-D-xylulose-5-phosphate synthase [bacterium]|nr:1-deoxy-D-xylulose-5-phosphate synthase [bacterium]
MALLEKIDSPADLKKLSREQLDTLCIELRAYIIDVVNKIGGHFGSSLGATELTVALHYLYNTPKDKIVWDVGHQAYGHKILTGRREALKTIRQPGGISGFPNRPESPYDTFAVGHAGTSISAALGFATQRDLMGETHKVIAVIGDGALTSGLAFEGLNNAGAADRDLLVILNDNRMSISPNVGAISHYLTRIITDPIYNRIKDRITNDPFYRKVKEGVWDLTGKIPVIGEDLRRAIGGFEEGLKGLLVPGILFEELGFRYLGPINGNDLSEVLQTLSNVRNMKGPVLLHIHTIKGKGAIQEDAEDPYSAESTKYHAVSPPKPKDTPPSLPRYQNVFGDAITELARHDSRIVGITAAMAEGTSLDTFQKAHPERFFDVGIAEQHAITFAAGIALEGGRPVAAIYSTFLQRAYDQIIHDVALQSAPVIFCMDRAGIAGADGPTHHGDFDLSYLMCVPNMIITAPKDGDELKDLLYTAVQQVDYPFGIRYPRDSIPYPLAENREPETLKIGSWERLTEGEDIALLAVGTMVDTALKAQNLLSDQGVEATVINCRFVKPMDIGMLHTLSETYNTLITIEENALEGGFGSAVARHLSDRIRPGQKLHHLGLPDRFFPHGSRGSLLDEAGLSPEAIAQTARRALSEQLTSP